METVVKKKRFYIIDILKVIACFFVFRIHMGPMTVYVPFVLFAVPIYIFITGYNYTQSSLRLNKPPLAVMLKRAVRLYIPYMAFAIVQLVLILALKADYNPLNIAISFFVGGYGPGNYYLLLMFQIILVFPVLLYFNKKKPALTLILCFVFYWVYHIFMRFVFPDNPEDVTTVGGIINKWTAFRWIFLIDSGIFFYIRRDKIKWWYLALLTLLDIIPYILMLTTDLPTLYIRGIPYHFISAGIVGLCIKYLGNISFGKFNRAVAYCGNATWHIFLFQQLYFWLIDLVDWQFGFTYISFPICFIGGLLFYTAQLYVTKLVNSVKCGKRAQVKKYLSGNKTPDAFDLLLGEWADGTLAEHLKNFGLTSVETNIDWLPDYKCLGIQARLDKNFVDIQIFKNSFTVSADKDETDGDREYDLESIARFDEEVSRYLEEFNEKNQL